jgi:hypothetical protein
MLLPMPSGATFKYFVEWGVVSLLLPLTQCQNPYLLELFLKVWRKYFVFNPRKVVLSSIQHWRNDNHFSNSCILRDPVLLMDACISMEVSTELFTIFLHLLQYGSTSFSHSLKFMNTLSDRELESANLIYVSLMIQELCARIIGNVTIRKGKYRLKP